MYRITQRVARFRRTRTRTHLVQGTDMQRGIVFVLTTGWWDGQDRIEMHWDGEVMDRWATTNPMDIDVFRRLVAQSLQRGPVRPLPT